MKLQKQDQKDKVRSMFDSIAGSYDFLNHFLSFGIDRSWRRRAIKIIGATHKNPVLLDVATGTGDLAIEAMKLDPVHITGIDISEKMLEIGRLKIAKKGLSGKINLIPGDSENIPAGDNCYDVVMSGFGVRNFHDLLAGLTDMKRVLKKGGLVMVLEFSRPGSFPFSFLYRFYFLKILPLTGRLFSKSRSAYRYLPESVMQFPDNEHFMRIMGKAGYINIRQTRLTGGVVSIYTGLK